MNLARVNCLLEALKLANQPDDYNFRSALKSELAKELELTPPTPVSDVCEDNDKRLEVIEDHFDRLCSERKNLIEAIRLMNKSF